MGLLPLQCPRLPQEIKGLPFSKHSNPLKQCLSFLGGVPTWGVVLRFPVLTETEAPLRVENLRCCHWCETDAFFAWKNFEGLGGSISMQQK